MGNGCYTLSPGTIEGVTSTDNWFSICRKMFFFSKRRTTGAQSYSSLSHHPHCGYAYTVGIHLQHILCTFNTAKCNPQFLPIIALVLVYLGRIKCLLRTLSYLDDSTPLNSNEHYLIDWNKSVSPKEQEMPNHLIHRAVVLTVENVNRVNFSGLFFWAFNEFKWVIGPNSKKGFFMATKVNVG